MPDQALISRRSIASAFPLAALAVLPAAALAYPATAEADGHLLELGRQWEASNASVKVLTERVYEAEDRTTSPPFPEAIYWRKSDSRFWIGFPSEREMRKGEETDRWWYRWPKSHQHLRDRIASWSASRSDFGDALIARAQEILDAFAAWERDDEANNESTGLTEAYDAVQQATEASAEIRRKIVRTPAHTLLGILLKASVAFWCISDDQAEFDEEFAHVLENDEHACGDSVTMSLVNDLAAFAASQKAVV